MYPFHVENVPQLTNLFNFTQPIIRYEISDVTGYTGESCECGSPLPTLFPVQGRTTELFYFKKPQGGYAQFNPFMIIAPLYYMHNIRQYQIVQSVRNELTFVYALQNKSADIKQELIHTLNEALVQKGLRNHITIHLKEVKSISRDERSGKYKYVISLGAPSSMDKA